MIPTGEKMVWAWIIFWMTTTIPASTSALRLVNFNGSCLDVRGGSIEDEAQPFLTDCEQPETKQSQDWTFTNQEGFGILSMWGKKGLNVKYGGTGSGNTIILYDFDNKARDSLWFPRPISKAPWLYYQDWHLIVSINDGLCLTSESDGTNIIQSTCEEDDNQLWRWDQRTYELQNKKDLKCLVYESSENPTKLLTADCKPSTPLPFQIPMPSRETWQFSSGIHQMIKAGHSGLCLDVNGGHQWNGAAVIQYQCLEEAINPNYGNQHWVALPVQSSPYFMLQNKLTSKCLRAYENIIAQFDCIPFEQTLWNYQ